MNLERYITEAISTGKHRAKYALSPDDITDADTLEMFLDNFGYTKVSSDDYGDLITELPRKNAYLTYTQRIFGITVYEIHPKFKDYIYVIRIKYKKIMNCCSIFSNNEVNKQSIEFPRLIEILSDND
jgi:hypothetical protein